VSFTLLVGALLSRLVKVQYFVRQRIAATFLSLLPYLPPGLVPRRSLSLCPFTWKKDFQGVIEDPIWRSPLLAFCLDVFPTAPCIAWGVLEIGDVFSGLMERKLSLSLLISCPSLFRYVAAPARFAWVWYLDMTDLTWWRESLLSSESWYFILLRWPCGPYRLQILSKPWWFIANCRDCNGQQADAGGVDIFWNKRQRGVSVFPDAGFYLMVN